jgi:hypothetical protein
VVIESNCESHLDWLEARLDELVPGWVAASAKPATVHRFGVWSNDDGSVSLTLDGSELGHNRDEHVALRYLATRLKLAVGEHAPAHVFVHAGVVALGGVAIVLPGHSFAGKTTLVRELVERGATYYSDDFAVFDAAGRVQPFLKPLSIRGQDGLQVEVGAERLGSVVATAPAPVGMMVFTSYNPASVWNPSVLSPGTALLRLVEHTLPIRVNPAFSLAVLRRAVTGCLVWASQRCDAGEVADRIFEHLLERAHANASPTPRSH